MSDAASCAPFQELLPELALGILDGRERAGALAHVATCPSCAAELEALSQAADAVVGAAPELEPPVGFEVRVLDAMHAGFRDRSRSRRRRRALAAAFAALLLLAGVGIGALVERPSAPAPSATLAADVSYAPFSAGGRPLGAALAYGGGATSWMFVAIDHIRISGPIGCMVETSSGATVDLGEFWLDGGSGTWSVRLPVATSALRRAVLTDGHGRVVASASFQT